MKNANAIRLYKDGKRLIIVIEDGNDIAPMIGKMIGAGISEIEGVMPAKEAVVKKPDIPVQPAAEPVQEEQKGNVVVKPAPVQPVVDRKPEKQETADLPEHKEDGEENPDFGMKKNAENMLQREKIDQDIPDEAKDIITDPFEQLKKLDTPERHPAIIRELRRYGHTNLRMFLLERNRERTERIVHAISS